MGFATIQPVEGIPKRNRRPFSLVSATVVVATNDSDGWSKQNKVVMQMQIHDSRGKCQYLFLTQEEIDKLLPMIVAAGKPSMQLQTALTSLSWLPDAELIKVLAELLAKKVKARYQP